MSAVPAAAAAELSSLIERERRAYASRRPQAQTLAARAAAHWPGSVPMHWMADWPTPFPLAVATARDVTLTDVDGHAYTDFCLGDTGAMFGHSPPPIAAAIAAQAARGLTCMLPDERVAAVGEALAANFRLPFWQVTQTATDANRAALRWARALTGRRRVLVFHGCYHGTVEETMVRRRGGRTVPREGAIGPAFDAAAAAELTRRHGALLVIDETHTLSSGPGGHAAAVGLEADFWVCGKAIAGGLPCAVLGFTAEVESRMRAVLAARAPGHSGMGTTLAANTLVFAALAAALQHLHVPATHALMQAAADRLEHGLRAMFAARGLEWHVSRVGARLEFGFGPAPHNGSEAEAAAHPQLEQALHLWLLNRGFLLTPFHNMMLTAPMLPHAAIDALCALIDEFLAEVGLA
jgi:glutamate-1-semialdehyde 2,1-aminomutase